MIILLLNIFFINTFSYKINASTEAKEIIKIGVYEDEPYISIDDKGNISLISTVEEANETSDVFTIGNVTEGEIINNMSPKIVNTITNLLSK